MQNAASLPQRKEAEQHGNLAAVYLKQAGQKDKVAATSGSLMKHARLRLCNETE